MKIIKVNLGHFRQQTSEGDFIDFAVFDAKSQSGTEEDNNAILNRLVKIAVEEKNLKIDRAALIFEKDGEKVFYGSTDLVQYLSRVGFPKWTHTLELQDP